MSQQELLTLKEQLIVLTRAAIAAKVSEDPVLIEFANRGLSDFINRVDIVELPQEEE